ncbi:MAG: PKD domain-containing protein, partial [Phaeodactylibacter sp.]|nr:PKD domain-containing protein [Phaeodactylibacter sp.]
MGYGGGSFSPGDTTYGLSIIDFMGGGGLNIFNEQGSEAHFNDTNASISDEDGNLQFYFNGLFIEDSSSRKMLNGDQVNMYDTTIVAFGYDLPQGAVALPWPELAERYVLFHESDDFLDGIGLIGAELRYSVIDMQLNKELGAVTEKRVLTLEDTLSWGQLTTTRHANGRDWWLLTPRKNKNQYYRIRLTPGGIINEGIQAVGQPVRSALGQACFSPDGKWYVRFNTVSISEGQFIDIYDFDRCGGLLSNHRKIHYDENAASGGIAISPNSRYLYVSSYLYIYQYDLWADDIEASRDTVAIYDGYTDVNGLGTRFYLAQLGPDGKIYLSCPNGVRELHVIHQPNEPGPACQAEQRGLLLPTFNASSLPNFPNYRLGPIDGSPCDTLGIDNIPLARWRYGQDTLEPLRVGFTDLSAYEPAEWLWDFGDGNTSQDTSPVHVFEQDGLYEVCLTVSNANGSDTRCRELRLGVVASGKAEGGSGKLLVQVFPNP